MLCHSPFISFLCVVGAHRYGCAWKDVSVGKNGQVLGADTESASSDLMAHKMPWWGSQITCWQEFGETEAQCEIKMSVIRDMARASLIRGRKPPQNGLARRWVRVPLACMCAWKEWWKNVGNVFSLCVDSTKFIINVILRMFSFDLRLSVPDHWWLWIS